MNKQQKYDEIMRQLNYKPIKTLLNRKVVFDNE